MAFKRAFFFTYSRQCRCKYSTNIKAKAEADPNLIKNLENQLYKPRHHPGVINVKTVSLPDKILEAIERVTEDYPFKRLLIDSDTLFRHLKGRVPPMEQLELKETRDKAFDQVMMKEKHVEITNDVDERHFKQKITDKVNNVLREKVYNWSPIDYNTYNSLLYLLARSAPEYAVLSKIFAEIQARDADYKPRSIFDFGSGVGTVTWAAKSYWNNIFEYFNVDISASMNDLAVTILQGGHSNTTQNLKGVFHRQFLPANNTTYDLVVSAFSMLELPSAQMRMQIILKLWNKTDKYLVVVEQGTNAGFKVINQIRDFVLRIQNDDNPAYVFSPCPHDKLCPRFMTDSTPCNFEVGYTKPFVKNARTQKERYSYVVLKKGKRNSVEDEWPRVVRENLVRSRHSICRMCTANGNLAEVIFTASKYGKSMYHCARMTKWGDRLPVSVSEMDEAEAKEEKEEITDDK